MSSPSRPSESSSESAPITNADADIAVLSEALDKLAVDRDDEKPIANGPPPPQALPPCTDEQCCCAWINSRLIQTPAKLLFVGESRNFSLPIAVAALRGGWAGLKASFYDGEFNLEAQWEILDHVPSIEKLDAEASRELLFKAITEAEDRVKENFKIFPEPLGPQSRSQRARDLLSQLKVSAANMTEDELRATVTNFSLSLDATLPNREAAGLLQAGRDFVRNIWFQCPWTSNALGGPNELILKFLAAAAEVQGPGDVIFLGLAMDTGYYSSQYQVETVFAKAEKLGYDRWESAGNMGFDLWGKERRRRQCFMRRALDLGY